MAIQILRSGSARSAITNFVLTQQSITTVPRYPHSNTTTIVTSLLSTLLYTTTTTMFVLNRCNLLLLIASFGTVSAFTGGLPMSRTSTTSTSTSTSTTLFNDKAPRHDVPSAQMELPPAIQAQMEAYQEHQNTAPKMDWATDVRTLVQYNHGFAVISTISKSDEGYPGGSVVGFAPEPVTGRPLFIFSGMSTHTQDLLADPKCSLTVAAKDFKGAADGRVNLMGTAVLVTGDAEKQACRDTYLAKHPGAFWVDFGDFNWFRMDVEKVRFVGGFARAGGVSAAEYLEAQPDVISEFGPDIAKHMNDDHETATIAMVHGNVPGMPVDPENLITSAIITSVDSLGMYVKVTRDKPVGYLPQQFKLRLPFSRPAADRKDIKSLIVEMTQKAAAANAAAAVKAE